MAPLKAEPFADGVYLGEEQLRRPHRGVVRLGDRGVPAAELVVADDAAAIGGELGVRLHVMPGGARPAVQAEQRELPRRLGLSGHPVPGSVPPEGQITLGGRQIITHVPLRVWSAIEVHQA